MRRTIIHSLIGAIFVGVSIVLLVFALQFQREYVRAHAAARTMRPGMNPSTLRGSSTPMHVLHSRAQWLTVGIGALAVIALFTAIRTRHLAWLACFLICGVLAAITFMRTGRQY